MDALFNPDLADVRGLERAKLALEVAAAGQHPLLLAGPPGSGNTLLARRIGGLLPDLDPELAAEASTLHGREVVRPPVRMPHHTVSVAGLFGGGSSAHPGEVSRAHGGVLALDELPEFSRAILEALPAVARAGRVELVRATSTTVYPARFLLVGMMNLCPCGYFGHHERVCVDSNRAIERYQQRVAGLQRVWDLAVRVPGDGGPGEYGEASAAIRERIEAARARRAARGGRALPLARGLELGRESEAARVRRVASTLAELGHTASRDAITPDAVALARSLYELPSAPAAFA